MSVLSDMESDFRTFVNENGIPVSVKYRTLTFPAGSHDEGILSESGNAMVGSVFLEPASQTKGDDVPQFLDGGAYLDSDRYMFTPSGIDVTSGASVVVDGGSYDCMHVRYIPNKTNLVYSKAFLRSKKVD